MVWIGEGGGAIAIVGPVPMPRASDILILSRRCRRRYLILSLLWRNVQYYVRIISRRRATARWPSLPTVYKPRSRHSAAADGSCSHSVRLLLAQPNSYIVILLLLLFTARSLTTARLRQFYTGRRSAATENRKGKYC